MKIKTLLFICILLIQAGAEAQTGISFTYYPNNSVKEILFANGEAFDIGANNPLLLELPVSYKANNVIFYNVKDAEYSDVQDNIPKFKAINDTSLHNSEWTNFTTYPVICEQTNTYFALSYLIIGSNENNGAIGCISNVYVYDSLGSLILLKEDLPIDINEILITENGKYLVYSFGYDYGEKNHRIVNPGIHIVDVKSGNIIDKIVIDSKSNHLVGLGLYKKNIISLVVEDPFNQEYDLYYYHSNNDKLYSITLPYKIYFALESIEDKGLIIPSLNPDTFYFSEMPIVEDLK